MNLSTLTISMALGSCFSIIWTIPFILFIVFGIRLYKITNKRQISMVFTRIGKNSSYVEDLNPRGWIWGKYYIGYIIENTDSNKNALSKSYNIFILCSNKFFKELINPDSKIMKKYEEEDEDDKDNLKGKIKFYERYGNYFWLEYKSREINAEYFIAKKNQKKIIEMIKDEYKKTKNNVSVIYGEPGCGKSMIPILLAKEMGGYLCDSFNPTDPGDDIGLIYSTIMPTEEKPLIIVLEEFDIIINKIHHNLIPTHKHIPIQVKDKTSWNSLFDRLDRGLYPNVIILLTSNVNPEYVDKLDKSYLRQGRVNNRYNLKDQ